MKSLIVNADDLGADKERNAGIFEAVNKGTVTSVSILPNGPAFDDAVERILSLKERHLSCGLHLNLSEGTPLTPGLRILTAQNGCFLGKSDAIRLLTSNLPKQQRQSSISHINEEWNRMGSCESASNWCSTLSIEIKTEIHAQMEKLTAAGLRVDHVDGHHHVHIFPAVVESVIETTMESGIKWIRTPEESISIPLCHELKLSNQQICEAKLFSKFAAYARVLFQKSGIKTTDNFRGLYFKGKFSISIFENLLQNLPEGTSEMMLHPGRSVKGKKIGDFSAFSTYEREAELAALMHPDFQLLLSKYNINLISSP